MDAPETAAESTLDPAIRWVDLWLGRLVIVFVFALMPVALARLPHYLEAGFAVMGFAAFAALFTFAVRIGQRLGLVGAAALADTPKTNLFEETTSPTPKTASVVSPVAGHPALKRLHADKGASRQTIAVPGRGRITYWSDVSR